ncbi:hypothetical protein EYF80_055209 [Liparis tanakae]|uniref:Uncharacterized protein n=1 Tax=Liparis tanakae TaxID=230148 RepID=A0A4Z2F107_9TELE|nr:hypothetical protein EYF80_055209 [Liparis tanakae]
MNLSRKAFRMRRSSKAVSVLGISETGEGGTVRKGAGPHLEDRVGRALTRNQKVLADFWLSEESGKCSVGAVCKSPFRSPSSVSHSATAP